MASLPTTETGDLRTIGAAIALVVLVGLGISVLNPLVSIALERAGVSATLSGLSASASGVGTVVIVAVMPAMARSLGLPALLGGAIVITALTVLAFPLTAGLPAWTTLRFILGAALGIVFTLSEFWINVAAPPARRGVVMGLYATTLYAGFAAGPLLLGALVDPQGPTMAPWLVTATLMTCALVPLALVYRQAPALKDHPSSAPWRFIRAAPAAMLGAFLFGVVETGAMLLLPVHGLRLGLAPQEATTLLAAFTLGNVALQIPIGMLSDKVPRLPLLAGLALASALCLVSLLGLPGQWVTRIILFVAGGIFGGIYPVALALLGERFSDSDLAAANGAVVALYSAGLIVGPPALGLAMDALGMAGLPLAMSTLLALYGAIILLAPKKSVMTP